MAFNKIFYKVLAVFLINYYPGLLRRTCLSQGKRESVSGIFTNVFEFEIAFVQEQFIPAHIGDKIKVGQAIDKFT